jgi:hypothetical protein
VLGSASRRLTNPAARAIKGRSFTLRRHLPLALVGEASGYNLIRSPNSGPARYCTSLPCELQSHIDMSREPGLTVAAEPFSGDPAAGTISRERSWSSPLILAAVLIVAAHVLLTVPVLTRGELSLDESGTFLVSTRPLADVFTVPTTFHSQPPLFYLALRAVATHADDEPALRMLPWAFMLALGVTILVWARELSPYTRVIAVAMLLLSDYGRYITVEIRPYSMAAFFSCWSCLLFWRIARRPTLTRCVAYVALTSLMAYTVAVASWIFAAQALGAAIIAWRDARRSGLRRALIERRQLLASLTVAGLIYLPYVLTVWRLQSGIGQTTALVAIQDGLNPRYFVSGPMYLTRAAYGIGFLALAAAAYAAWEGFRRREAFIGFLILIVAVQISLTHGFLAGRSGFAFRYLAPAYPALCMLVGIGADAMMRNFRMADLWLVGASSAILLAAIASFPRAYGRQAVGPWRQLRADLVKLPGDKVVFFDVGWDGERLQYETRHDPSISVMTDPGTGWATGGVIMPQDYVRRIIQERAPRTSMFFYQYDSVWRRSTFDSAFVPEMQRLGCVKTYERNVPTYTRANPDTLKGAVVVGFRCHAA